MISWNATPTYASCSWGRNVSTDLFKFATETSLVVSCGHAVMRLCGEIFRCKKSPSATPVTSIMAESVAWADVFWFVTCCCDSHKKTLVLSKVIKKADRSQQPTELHSPRCEVKSFNRPIFTWHASSFEEAKQKQLVAWFCTNSLIKRQHRHNRDLWPECSSAHLPVSRINFEETRVVS
jgi:hypothetical protein